MTENRREIGVRAYYVKRARQTIVVRVYKIGEDRAEVIAKPEITNRTLHDTKTIKAAIMGVAWIFSLFRDYRLHISRYNSISGEAIFIK